MSRLLRRLTRAIALATLALLGLATAACAAPAGRPMPPAVQAVPQDLVFVIPLGAAAAQMRGDPDAFHLPPEIDLVAGQRIVVRNDDQAMHYFFYMPIAPGQEVSRTFDQPGQYGYSTIYSCSLTAGVDTLSVHVAPRAVTT